MLRLFAPTLQVSAHCDLPCGVYDPAQARIEAESIKAIIAKANDSDDADFRTRAVLIKEQRSELVKHHLWVLWTDYFKAPALRGHAGAPAGPGPARRPGGADRRRAGGQRAAHRPAALVG